MAGVSIQYTVTSSWRMKTHELRSKLEDSRAIFRTWNSVGIVLWGLLNAFHNIAPRGFNVLFNGSDLLSELFSEVRL